MTNPLQAGVDHAELRRLAEAATPGPWQTGVGPNTGQRCIWGSGDPDRDAPWIAGEIVNRREFAEGESNAAYIAAANPAVMVALLNEIDALRAAPVLPDRGWRPRESYIADEEDGPVVGILIDLENGAQIWSGEASDSLLSRSDDDPRHSGCFVMVSAGKGTTRVIAQAATVEDGIHIARCLALPDAPAEGGL